MNWLFDWMTRRAIKRITRRIAFIDMKLILGWGDYRDLYVERKILEDELYILEDRLY